LDESGGRCAEEELDVKERKVAMIKRRKRGGERPLLIANQKRQWRTKRGEER
jgi:hypothetical protein